MFKRFLNLFNHRPEQSPILLTQAEQTVRNAYIDALIESIQNTSAQQHSSNFHHFVMQLCNKLIDYKEDNTSTQEEISKAVNSAFTPLFLLPHSVEHRFLLSIMQVHNVFNGENPLLDYLFRRLATPAGDELTHDPKRMSALSRTCKAFNLAFKPKLEALAAPKLITFILAGNEKAVCKILDANPQGIFWRGSGVDPVGRHYENVTALEAALLCGDIQMVARINAYFKEEDQDERLAQCHRIFPEGNVDAVIKAQKVFNFDAIIEAISGATAAQVEAQRAKTPNNSALCQAMNAFREDFRNLSLTETMSNLKHLLKAYEIYANDERVNNWDFDKKSLFFVQIIGYAQSQLPQCIKQIYHQGMSYYTQRLETGAAHSERRDSFKYAGDSLRFRCNEGVGFDFAGRGSGHVEGDAWGCWVGGRPLSNLMSCTQIELTKLMRTACSHPTSILRN